MRKTYMMLLALVFTVLGATTATAQKIYKAELDKSMFKAWDSNLPGANEVADPEPEPKANGNFSCVSDFYKEVGAYGTIYGSPSVYYLWYADITGTKTMTVTGTVGMKIRVMLNREPYVEGGTGDADGGAYVELIETVGENGTAVFDLSSYEYLHLNAIKVPAGSSAGVVRSIVLEGTVKPVIGILSVINNGDAEGDDLSSFPVSFDGPNNGGTANDLPEVVAGGVDGSKCFKVTSHTEPTETWHTQFYIKSDEVMAKGSKWKLVMYIKADRDARITTSAQAQPRTWKGGMGIDEFSVSSEWKKFEWNGEIGVDDFQSIAFDLNNGDEEVPNANGDGTIKINRGVTFYFDNIEFGYDLGGTSPITALTAGISHDIIQVDLGGTTNMKNLVKATGKDRLIYPDGCATVTWDGVKVNVESVEGLQDGNLYIFLQDDNGAGSTEFNTEGAKIVVSFKNPEDAAYQIVYTSGKWEGQSLPEFSGLECTENSDIDDIIEEYHIWSYLWGAPVVQVADPEEGSFNLPVDTKSFKMTFNQNVYVSSIAADLDGEKLVATSEDGAEKSKVIILTRTGSGELAGEMALTISSAQGEHDYAAIPDDDHIIIKYSFGPLKIDPNDQPEDKLPDYFATTDQGHVPEGYIIDFQGNQRTSEDGDVGSGPRMFNFGEDGDFTKGLYYREGNVTYGKVEDHLLTLEAGKTYTVSFTSAMWKDNGSQQTFQILNENEDEVEFLNEKGENVTSATINNTPNVNGSQNTVNGATKSVFKFTPKEDGNYILKWSVGGYNEVLIANVSVKYEPSTLGYQENKLLTEALEKAKSTRNGNSDERYDGPAYTTLDEAIKKIEAEKDSYTAPSSYKNAAAELEADAKAMTDHRKLCDTYDPLPEQVQQLVENNAEKKFAKTELYATLTSLAAKYGEKKTQTLTDPDTEEQYETEAYVTKVLKDDAELQTAVDELNKNITLGKNMFTEGRSTIWDAWNASKPGSGYCVLLERIRRGVEALKSLGVDESNALIVEANQILSDDDALADAIKNRIKAEIYGQLKNANNTLFAAEIDDDNLEETAKSYDMSVFVKNPNIYALDKSSGYKESNVPGWTVPTTNKPGLYDNWTDRGLKNIPQDIAFSSWKANIRMEQTVTDLPAGVYTVKFGAGSWNGNADWIEGGFCYVKTSETTPLGEGEEEDLDTHFAGYSMFLEGQVGPDRVGNHEIPDIVVKDGKLTFGVNFGSNDQAFFNEVEIFLTAPAENFDYGKAYEEVMTGVDDAKTAKVRGLELYDLNGRRITTARKGLVIVKKTMSDGTVKTEKVIK